MTPYRRLGAYAMSTEWTGRAGADEPVAPPVLGAEYAGRGVGGGSAVAYVPSQRLRPGDTEATLELRNTEDGRVAMLAYSTLERLVEGCGESQPWVAVPMDRVQNLQELSGADVTLWDVPVPDEVRHTPGEEDR